MNTNGLSTIAQMLYPMGKTPDFARIVVELETVLSHMRGVAVDITWDCDDVVTFDVPDTRFLLAFAELTDHSLAGCLTVSVGPGPDCDIVPVDAEYDLLCSRLVERIQNRFFPAAVTWRQLEGTIGADQVDELIETLPGFGIAMPPIEDIIEAVTRTDRSKARASMPRRMRAFERKAQPAVVAAEIAEAAAVATPASAQIRRKPVGAAKLAANDVPDLPLPRDAELARLRRALYPPIGADGYEVEYSTQMRLAVHCLNATLIVVWAPLGVAVTTYTILRGPDMRLSGGLVAIAATLIALAQSPIGDSMMAMAGI